MGNASTIAAFFFAFGACGSQAVVTGAEVEPLSRAPVAPEWVAGTARAPFDDLSRSPHGVMQRSGMADWLGRPATDRPRRAWQESKSARLAMVSSFLVPGLGQLYNEREFWALVAAGVQFYFIGRVIVEQRLTNHYRNRVHADPEDSDARVLFELHRDDRIQSTWLFGLTALVSGLQSFVDAHLFDFDDSPPGLGLGWTRDGQPAAAVQLHF